MFFSGVGLVRQRQRCAIRRHEATQQPEQSTRDIPARLQRPQLRQSDVHLAVRRKKCLSGGKHKNDKCITLLVLTCFTVIAGTAWKLRLGHISSGSAAVWWVVRYLSETPASLEQTAHSVRGGYLRDIARFHLRDAVLARPAHGVWVCQSRLHAARCVRWVGQQTLLPDG